MASWHPDAQEMRDYMAFGIEGAPDYTDEHECGQLRLTVAGEQVSLLPLPDGLIPTCDEPQAVDEFPGALKSPRGIRALSDEELQPFIDEIMRFSEPIRKVIAREGNKRAQARRHSFDESA